MVGVPRSKACNTCKQRKVLCSLEKPQCRTCVKASRVCLGYQRETIFIHDSRTSGGASKGYRKSQQVNKVVIPPKKGDTWFDSIGEVEEAPRFGLSATAITKTMAPSTHSVYSQQIFGNFLSSSTSKSRSSNKSGNSLTGSWFEMIPTLPGMTTALEISFLAICTAMMGRAKGDNVMVRESLRLYTRGLRELQRALWSPALMYLDETSAACVALILYEIVECPNQSVTGWQNHMKGCARLFELKGAAAFSSDFGHKCFVSFRIMEIQQALVERRHTFLAKSEWINDPWKGHEKTQLDKFLDIMVSLPSAMADGTAMLAPLFAAPSSDPIALLHGVMALLDRGWKLDSKLQDFYKELESATQGPVYTPQLAKPNRISDLDSAEGQVFTTAFYFANLQTAHLVMMYWAASAILWSGFSVTYAILSNYKLDTFLPPLGHRADRANLAKNICQTVEYCMQDEHEAPGKTSAVFPLKVAIETLNEIPGCERELAWAVDAMNKISSDGIRLMKFTGDPLTDHAYLAG